MGDHFKTDIGQLEQFLTDLERCVDELNEARSAQAGTFTAFISNLKTDKRG
ncbi:hypothetical protein GCM10022403_061730 [Streptomyces coacervatus]|uniref:Uncharacterized protein n=1 Tax=Streptomyces coacervatus TaxID=647381 RepID=A0ABP7IJI4_9ACTN